MDVVYDFNEDSNGSTESEHNEETDPSDLDEENSDFDNEDHDDSENVDHSDVSNEDPSDFEDEDQDHFDNEYNQYNEDLETNNGGPSKVIVDNDTAGGSAQVSDSDGEGEVCPICLNHFVGQELGSPEECDHIFCLECIEEWSRNTNVCPIDRLEFNNILVKHSVSREVLKKQKVVVRPREAEETLPEDTTTCEICHRGDHEDRLLLCDSCDLAYHCECLSPPLRSIPIDEWFCPPCTVILNRTPKAPTSRTTPRRVIPRTQVSESVRLRIQTGRIQNFTDFNNPQPSSSRSTVPRKRKVVRKRRKYRKRRTVKPKVYARTVKSVSKLGKGKLRAEPVAKRRYVRRRKYKKRRKCQRNTATKTKTKRSQFASKPLAAPSVRKRIAGHLGLGEPLPGHTTPSVKKTSLRKQESALSLFGNPNQLMDFEENYVDDEPSSRIKSTSVELQCTSTPVDILSNIMNAQEVLRKPSKDIQIERDGSLKLKNPSRQVRKTSSSSPQTPFDVKPSVVKFNIKTQSSSHLPMPKIGQENKTNIKKIKQEHMPASSSVYLSGIQSDGKIGYPTNIKVLKTESPFFKIPNTPSENKSIKNHMTKKPKPFSQESVSCNRESLVTTSRTSLGSMTTNQVPSFSQRLEQPSLVANTENPTTKNSELSFPKFIPSHHDSLVMKIEPSDDTRNPVTVSCVSLGTVTTNQVPSSSQSLEQTSLVDHQRQYLGRNIKNHTTKKPKLSLPESNPGNHNFPVVKIEPSATVSHTSLGSVTTNQVPLQSLEQPTPVEMPNCETDLNVKSKSEKSPSLPLSEKSNEPISNPSDTSITDKDNAADIDIVAVRVKKSIFSKNIASVLPSSDIEIVDVVTSVMEPKEDFVVNQILEAEVSDSNDSDIKMCAENNQFSLNDSDIEVIDFESVESKPSIVKIEKLLPVCKQNTNEKEKEGTCLTLFSTPLLTNVKIEEKLPKNEIKVHPVNVEEKTDVPGIHKHEEEICISDIKTSYNDQEVQIANQQMQVCNQNLPIGDPIPQICLETVPIINLEMQVHDHSPKIDISRSTHHCSTETDVSRNTDFSIHHAAPRSCELECKTENEHENNYLHEKSKKRPLEEKGYSSIGCAIEANPIKRKKKSVKHEDGKKKIYSSSLETDANAFLTCVEGLVKQILKPFYIKKDISKEHYKEIMRRSVPKIMKNSEKGVINTNKVKSLVLNYISMFVKLERR